MTKKLQTIRKIIFQAGIGLSFIPSLINAQIPSWPKEKSEASSTFSGMNLPDKRYVPSTKRYNLVWGDQMVPSNYTDGQLEFAAKNYMGTQKIWSNQASQFRAYNPNFLIIAYHLASGINPEHNSDAPDPKSNSGSDFIGSIAPEGYVNEWTNNFLPWLSNKGITVGSNTFEEMFQHYDQVDPSKRVWHGDPQWLLNLGNDNVKEYVASTTLNWMQGNKDEGTFFDVAVETDAWLWHPNVYDPEPNNFEWWQAPHGPTDAVGQIADRGAFPAWMNGKFLPYFQYIYKKFHNGTDYLIIPNVDQMVTTIYDPTWIDGDGNGETLDGAMMENFGGVTGEDMWLTLDRGVRHLTGRGKILIAQIYTSDPAERYRRSAMYMLIKNENSFINIQGGGISWYPEYEIDLGDQSAIPTSLNSLRVAGSGSQSLFKRTFQNGMVLVNTSSNAMDYQLEGSSWSRIETSGGGNVGGDGMPVAQAINLVPVSGKISIPAGNGIILKNNIISEVAKTESSSTIQVYPNPSAGNFFIELPSNATQEYSVQVSNALGIQVYTANGKAAGNTIQIENAGIPSGIYFVNLSLGTQKFISKIVIK